MMPEGLPAHWVSIDPGDQYVGMATWCGKTCEEVVQTQPANCVDNLCLDINLELVVYEKFALDPRRARAQDGSEFLTSQMIGVIKYLCRRAGIPSIGYRNNEHKRIVNMDWYTELVSDKARERELPYWTPGPRGGTKVSHKLDAWTLGMWHKHKLGYTGGV